MLYSDKARLIRFWRKRAEQIRATAASFEDLVAKKGFLDAADGYDEMADRSEAEMEVKGNRRS